MFGSSILVAPKLNAPSDLLRSFQKHQVEYLLPESEQWYDYLTYKKVATEGKGKWIQKVLSDDDFKVYVKAGTILPILLHDDCGSILECLANNVQLSIYLDQYGNASGSIYLDDGQSYAYQKGEEGYRQIEFSFENEYITASNVGGSFDYGAKRVT